MISLIAVIAAAAAAAAAQSGGGDVRLRAIGGDAAAGVAGAVVVERGALVHTALILPEDRDGRLLAGGEARAQAEHVLENLGIALEAAQTTLDALVRLHVYVANPSVTAGVDAAIAARFGGRAHRPALTLVESAMPRQGVLVAMDAVAATSTRAEPGQAMRLYAPGLPRRSERSSHAAVLPEGPFVTVSGRAARGEFETAVQETMEQLRGDLAAVGLTFEHVIQVKSFLGDMARAPELERIVEGSFDGPRVPPQVVTEWPQDTVPAEIELVATAPAGDESPQRVQHVEPISGRYSRVARAGGGRPVYLSGLHGGADAPVTQVDEMFAALLDLLRASGSDVRHLVKATYYVADPAADARINEIRPTVFDPQHPPAASKLTVRGTGRAGRYSTFDMIAVTTGP